MVACAQDSLQVGITDVVPRSHNPPLSEYLRDLPIAILALRTRPSRKLVYSFGGACPGVGRPAFQSFLNRAVLLPESFRGRLLLRRRPAVTLAAGRSLPRSVETARSIALHRLAVKRRNIDEMRPKLPGDNASEAPDRPTKWMPSESRSERGTVRASESR